MGHANQNFWLERSFKTILLLGCSCFFNAVLAQNADKCNEFYIGPSVIFEDSYKPFKTYGINAAYTHALSPKMGLTGDAGANFGSSNGVDYTKLQLLGGLSYIPPYTINKVAFSPHVLGGVSNIRSKYGETSSSNTAATLAAGTNISLPLKGVTLTGRLDYNPTFSSGGMSNNFRVGVGLSFNSCKNKPTTYSTKTRDECKASKNTKELKISLAIIEETAKSVEEIMNKIPRVEAKIAVKPQIAVKKGEECCSKDLPPAPYTELKGGVEGSCEVNINLWGIPDLNYSLKIWPVLLIAEFKCKLFAGPTGKANIDGVGKYYGELGGTNPRPDCKACYYLNYKLEYFLRIGVKAGGSIKIYHWTPFGGGKAGFDVTKDPDEKIEASAEASVSLGGTGTGTYAVNDDCKKPPAGLHGAITIGKAKANLKFNIKLGPLSFDPNFEVNLFDGWELSF